METILGSILGSGAFAGLLGFLYKRYGDRLLKCRCQKDFNDETCECILTNRPLDGPEKQVIIEDEKKEEEEFLKIELPVICANPLLANFLRREILYFKIHPNEKFISMSIKLKKLTKNETFFQSILHKDDKNKYDFNKLFFGKIRLNDDTYAIINSQPIYSSSKQTMKHIEGGIIRIDEDIYNEINPNEVLLSYFSRFRCYDSNNEENKKHVTSNNNIRMTRSLGPHIDVLKFGFDFSSNN